MYHTQFEFFFINVFFYSDTDREECRDSCFPLISIFFPRLSNTNVLQRGSIGVSPIVVNKPISSMGMKYIVENARETTPLVTASTISYV